jgi:hypothetical protein
MNHKVFLGAPEKVGHRPFNAIAALTRAAISDEVGKPMPPINLNDIKEVLDWMTFLEMRAAQVDDIIHRDSKLIAICQQVASNPEHAKHIFR